MRTRASAQVPGAKALSPPGKVSFRSRPDREDLDRETSVATFDLAEVRTFTAGINAKLDSCDNGEGMECANLDSTLRQYAVLCCEFCEEVRRWGRAIFYGQASFDPEVENAWLSEGTALYSRASNLWAYGQEMKGECFVLENGAALGSSLWRLERLLVAWVTPKPAIAPLARHGLALTPAAKEEMQKRVDALPPLPTNWQPTDSRRRTFFRKLQGRRNP
jgi:hypothetical protein